MKVKKYFYLFLLSFLLIFTGCLPQDTGVEELSDQKIDISIKDSKNNDDSKDVLSKDKPYYSLDDVCDYLFEYKNLPKNYISKKKAKDLGWIPSKANLWDIKEGAVIGGDHFGNYENKLPKASYKEADVNYYGGSRNEERIVYDQDFNIYYTKDHYESFERIEND